MRIIHIAIVMSVVVMSSCAKKKPEKHLLGRWEITTIDTARGKEKRPDIYEAFKKDLFYLTSFTFYENNVVHFNFKHTLPVNGYYEVIKPASKEENPVLKVEHVPIKDSTHARNFTFEGVSFHIEKMTSRRMTLLGRTTSIDVKHGKGLHFKFKKTGWLEE